jgi:hypothetical protein
MFCEELISYVLFRYEKERIEKEKNGGQTATQTAR